MNNEQDIQYAAADAVSDSTPVETRLKWFNHPKGFGFVVPEGEDIDAFLHITKLQKANILSLGDGARLICCIERGPKGAQVCEVVELIDAGINPEKISAGQPAENREEKTIRLNGSVKWYKEDKGFGFITPDDGRKDVFIHKTCLERHRIDMLEPGTRIAMIVKIVPKGREVVEFEFIED